MKGNLWLLLSCCVVGILEATQCLSGWMRHGEKCYHFSRDTEPWMVAELVCRQLGGHLAEIGSADENNFIGNEVKILQVNNWIGASDIQVEGEWMWAHSKTTLEYTHWYPGEPNGVGNENCAEIKPTLYWNDRRCDASQHYVCEAEPSEVVAVG